MEPWFVRDTGFTERLKGDDRQVFLEVCPRRPYEEGEVLFHAGSDAVAMHVVVEGQVILERYVSSGRRRIVALCGPDDFIGEAFLADEGRYLADARALTSAVTCPVSREQFEHLAGRSPGVITVFMEALARRISSCYDALLEPYSTIDLRVARVLLEQAERYGQNQQGGWVRFETPLRHHDVADAVGATRVSVSTAVGDLRERGLVEGSRGDYRVNLPALRQLVESE